MKERTHAGDVQPVGQQLEGNHVTSLTPVEKPAAKLVPKKAAASSPPAVKEPTAKLASKHTNGMTRLPMAVSGSSAPSEKPRVLTLPSEHDDKPVGHHPGVNRIRRGKIGVFTASESLSAKRVRRFCRGIITERE
jgi:hypothetical protein